MCLSYVVAFQFLFLTYPNKKNEKSLGRPDGWLRCGAASPSSDGFCRCVQIVCLTMLLNNLGHLYRSPPYSVQQ
jgi:hypothetical protein